MNSSLVCMKCKEPIEREPKLGHRQGGLVEVRYCAITHPVVLCARCKEPLHEFDQVGDMPWLMRGTMPRDWPPLMEHLQVMDRLATLID